MRDKLGRFVKGYRVNPNTEFKLTLKDINCKGCGKIFHPANFSIQYCSKKCWAENHISWNKGIKTGIKPWLGKKRLNISGKNNYFWKGGKPNCKECNKQLSSRKATYCQNCANRIFHSGEKNVNWRGGITPQNEKERKSPAYRRWRRAVLKRDDFQCIWCGAKEKLEVDHIKPFAFFPDLRTEITNGRTLCIPCHQKTFVFIENQYIKRREVIARENFEHCP